MSCALKSQRLLAPVKRACIPYGNVDRIGCGFGSQLQQVRRYPPVSGPPRYQISTGQKFILGIGPLGLMLAIPIWSLFSLPRWSAIHRGIYYEE